VDGRRPKENVMGDARFENFATDPFDGTRFASMIRKSVHEVVEAALARRPEPSRVARTSVPRANDSANALVAYADVPDRPHTTPSRAANERELPSGDESDRRALAFRAMAGVRVSALKLLAHASEQAHSCAAH
jgi:hypothetical protein